MSGTRLWAYGVFGAVLSAAGLPLYIHAPKFYVDEYGVGLGVLGGVLFALRLLDVVQDPALGLLSARIRAWRGVAVGGALALMGGGMVGLFAVAPPFAPVIWFALMLIAVFSAFSFLTINFYAQGVAKAAMLRGDIHDGHLRVARWRESGALIGICLAAIAPVALMPVTGAPFALFGGLFAVGCAAAALAMRGEWTPRGDVSAATGLRPILRDATARRLLAIALVNAAPVAVSSTLFLFFVESRLGAPGLEGPLLLVFFLCAALSSPVWSRLAERAGARRVLLAAMVASVPAFATVLLLGEGDTLAFGAICVVTGALVGADLTLLPALFARRMAVISPGASEGFGLWSLVQKTTLAVAAVALLPALEAAGFRSGQENDAAALWTLSLLYAGLPCVLKFLAIALLVVTDPEAAPA